MSDLTTGDVFGVFQRCVAEILGKFVEIPVRFSTFDHGGTLFVKAIVKVSSVRGIKIKGFNSDAEFIMHGSCPASWDKNSNGAPIITAKAADAGIYITGNGINSHLYSKTKEELSKSLTDILILDPNIQPPTAPLSRGELSAVLKKILELCEKIYAKPLEDARD